MHSPNAIPNRLTANNFIQLKPWVLHEMTYNRHKTVLLPPPYQTNCKNYDLDDKQDFRFRSECINHCIHDGLRKECSLCSSHQKKGSEVMENCTECLFMSDLIWRKYSFIYNLNDIKPCLNPLQIEEVPLSWKNGNTPLAQEYNRNRFQCNEFVFNRVQSECQNSCQSECTNRYYNYEIKKESNLYQESEWKKVSHVRITHNHLPDQTNEHLPETTFVTLTCNFGGLLGMWLGLSAMALFHFLLKII